MTLPGAPPSQKSESTAQTLAVAGSLAGPVMMLIGSNVSSHNRAAGTGLVYAGAVVSLLGPSAGHWYAGKVLTPGLGLRVAGAAAATLGVVTMIACGVDEGVSDHPDHCGGGGVALLVAGGATYLAGTIYDIATADNAARSWNERHRYEVAPIAIVGTHGVGAGLGVSGDFN